jgi:hypothetical protein
MAKHCELKPNRSIQNVACICTATASYKLSKDPLFIDKVRGIVGLYVKLGQIERRTRD